ncbi:MAG: hypothetical protein R3E39_08100 [Anaerolineae bacterium]
MAKKVSGIGAIEFIPVRDAFPHEAHHFTTWLEGNIQVLSEALGLPLLVEAREVPVGSFRADLVCLDGQNNRIIIENQLERTDHDHLGKMMTYMIHLKANTAIWITPEPRIEHQTVIEHFNRVKPAGMAFYLVKVNAIRIDDSRPAPMFTVISHPDDQSISVQDGDNGGKSQTSGLPPVWCVFPRRDEETYRLFLKKKVIGIGFSDMGDLSKLPPTREAFRKAWTKGLLPKFRRSNERTINAMYSMVYRFVHEVAIGDLVIYPPTWYERTIHVGKITGDYQYDPNQPQGYVDLRAVKWTMSIPRESFTESALKGINVPLALFKVQNDTFLAELEGKLDGHR